MVDLLFNPQELSDARRMTEAFVDRYLAGLADRPVFPDVDREELRELMNRPIPNEGETLGALFEELDRVIIPNATHTAHPRFLPYVQPSPNALSPFAETVAAVINQNCNLWHLSPAANAVEKAVLNWFAGMFGFPGTVGGIITSGGSMANLVALTAAHDQKLGPAARRQGLQGRTTRLVLYTSDEAHSSIDKAASVLGLGSDYVRHILTDDTFRMRVDMLAEAVAADRASGLEPFCVVGSAGTVTTGAVDPIAELSVFCRREGLWLHIDGAYGALVALSPRFSGWRMPSRSSASR